MTRISRTIRCRGGAGFTLIEIMVASLLLLIVMAGFVPFFLSGLERSSQGRYKSTATNVARERMEQIRRLDYREIQQDTANPSDPNNLSMRFAAIDAAESERGTPFNVVYAVNPSAYGAGELKEVSVTVSWTAPPAVSPAVITSLIHQQFMGPRGSWLQIGSTTFPPTDFKVTPDPDGTPFPLFGDPTGTSDPDTVAVRYHIAEADWGLALSNITPGSITPRNVYMLLRFVDDAGSAVYVGPAADNYRIDSSHLLWDESTGTLTDVYFEYPFDINEIPDGYWELQAVAYNEFDQPGNIWRYRVRVEDNDPEPPISFTAIGKDDQTIDLEWIPGADRDHKSWILERAWTNDSTWSEAEWTAATTWTTLTTLVGTQSRYTDAGHKATSTHPFGDSTFPLTHYYRYRLHPVDLDDNHGTPVTASEQLPPTTTTTVTGSTDTTASTVSTTTTSVTTPPPSTTYSVIVENQDMNFNYDVEIKDTAGDVIWSQTVNKNKSATAGDLPSGSYTITADRILKKDTDTPIHRAASFNLPTASNSIVLTILE